MELSDGWVAIVADDDLRRDFADPGLDVGDWHPVAVPGHWRSTPAFADVDDPVLYRATFETGALDDRRRLWLTFDGLFYQGDVWLDGTYLGDTEGYFVSHTFEITEHAAAGREHTLAVEVGCSPQGDTQNKRNITGAFQDSDYLDPTWNPGGIWRPVRITETGPVRIARLTTRCIEATEARATVAFVAQLDSTVACDARLRTTIGPVGAEQDLTVAAGTNTVEWTVTVDRPRLWWPRALGEAHLEPLTVEVDLGGDVSDARSFRTGLRTVELDDWILSVNGERLFAKGAAQGPTRLALADATGEECRRDVELAVAAGLDLLRIHGHVARLETYQAADAAGLLLWQDFPLHGGYSRHIRKQAVRQATEMAIQLSAHPSIAIWCGHDAPLGRSGLRDVAAHQLPSWNRTVLDRAVKRAIRAVDDTRPIIAHSGVLPHLPALRGTDSHLSFGWDVGDERDLAGFARAMPSQVRFPSLAGAQAVPDTDEFLDAADWPDVDWNHLAERHGLQSSTLDRHVPRDGHSYESWKAATQSYQATVVRRQIETLRRLKYRPAGGFTQRFLADGAPGITASLLDHHRRPKAAFDALRAACAPVIVVADRLPAAVAPGEAFAVDVHVVSDRRVPLTGDVTATLTWTGPDGDVVGHSWRFGGDVPADACVRVGTLQFEAPRDVSDTTRGLVLRLDGQVGDDVVANEYAAVLNSPV